VPLLLARIDDRLIHGQVALGWGRSLRPTLFLVVSDTLRADVDRTELCLIGVPDDARGREWDRAAKKWFTMGVTQIASFATLTLDSKQRPHISFADHGTGKGARLRHAAWDGSSWKITPINIQPGTVVGYYTGIGLDAKDNPFFSFYDYADRNESFRLRLRADCSVCHARLEFSRMPGSKPSRADATKGQFQETSFGLTMGRPSARYRMPARDKGASP